MRVIEMGNLPKDFEMEQVLFSDELPENLSYPDSFKLYFETVKNAIDWYKNFWKNTGKWLTKIINTVIILIACLWRGSSAG